MCSGGSTLPELSKRITIVHCVLQYLGFDKRNFFLSLRPYQLTILGDEICSIMS